MRSWTRSQHSNRCGRTLPRSAAIRRASPSRASLPAAASVSILDGLSSGGRIVSSARDRRERRHVRTDETRAELSACEYEHDGEGYAASPGVHSLVEATRAAGGQVLLKGKAGPISHPVIEPYALPQSPYDVFVAGKQNDVPILVGSNADEARSLVSHLETVKASSFCCRHREELGTAAAAAACRLSLRDRRGREKSAPRIRARFALRMGRLGMGAAGGDEGPQQRVLLSLRARAAVSERVGL